MKAENERLCLYPNVGDAIFQLEKLVESEDFEIRKRFDISVDEDAAIELLRILEKEGIVKIKKGRVKARK